MWWRRLCRRSRFGKRLDLPGEGDTEVGLVSRRQRYDAEVGVVDTDAHSQEWLCHEVDMLRELRLICRCPCEHFLLDGQ
jgi:hypothetical protein